MARTTKKTKTAAAAAPAANRRASRELPVERQVRALKAQIVLGQLKELKKSLPVRQREAARESRAARARAASGSGFDNVGGGGGGSRNSDAGRFGLPYGKSSSYRGGGAGRRQDFGRQRDRARRAFEENVIAHSLLETETDYVVAEGYQFQPRSSSPAWNKEAQRRFWEWMETADLSGKHKGADLFRMTWREPRKDGDGLHVRCLVDGYPRLQYVPGDLIGTPYGRTEEVEGYDRKRCFDGVEEDENGRAIRYWVKQLDEVGKEIWRHIPAENCSWLSHLTDTVNPRGLTVYSRIFEFLDHIDTYIGAVTRAAIMACIFGLIEKRRNPNAVVAGVPLEENSSGDLQKAITLDEDGMLKVIGTDESVMQVQAQQPMQQTPDFVRVLQRIAALGFQMPLEIAARDLSQVNFSGGRIGLLGFYRSCRIKQNWHKSHDWYPNTSWWLRVEKRRQELGFADAFKEPFPADYDNYELQGREYEANNRLEEAQADLLEFSMGRPMQDIDAEHGRDFIENRRRWKENLDWCLANGIPLQLSSLSRDAQTKVTAVDADGNPIGGANTPLNGVQITSALAVLAQVSEKTLAPKAAIVLLTKLGITTDDATQLASAAAEVTGVTPGDRDFGRQYLLKLMDVAGAKQVLYNITDIPLLATDAGLPIDKSVQKTPDQGVPLLPVVADSGPQVAGGERKDPAGDLVGGTTVPDGNGGDGAAGAVPAGKKPDAPAGGAAATPPSEGKEP